MTIERKVCKTWGIVNICEVVTNNITLCNTRSLSQDQWLKAMET